MVLFAWASFGLRSKRLEPAPYLFLHLNLDLKVNTREQTPTPRDDMDGPRAPDTRSHCAGTLGHQPLIQVCECVSQWKCVIT